MDDFRDVMLSEPPQHKGTGYTGYRGTFENYKGILLCDRPSDQKPMGAQQPFLPPGAVEGPPGVQPSLEQLQRHVEIRKNLAHKKVRCTAQQQHRRRLRELNATKMKEKLSSLEQGLEQEAQFKRFREKQSKLRKAVFGVNNADSAIAAIAPGHNPHAILGTFKSKTEDVDEVTEYLDPLPPIPTPPISVVSTPVSNSSVKKKKEKAKPKWAMTEEEAFSKEMKETDDLVKFAESLDYEKYLDDYEIREALSIMRERVEELKSEELFDNEQGRRLHFHNQYCDDINGIYDDHERAIFGIRVSVRDGGLHIVHDSSPWSPASGGTYANFQVNGMPFGDEILSGVFSQNTINWSNGMIWIKKEERARNAGLDPFANKKLNGIDYPRKDDDAISTFTTLSERKKRLISEEAMCLAEKILQSSSSLRAVHSKMSLGRVLEELTHKAYNDEKKQFNSMKKPMETTGQYVPPPAVALHQPKSIVAPPRVLVQMKKSQDYVQNLPYMYRCPSI